VIYLIVVNSARRFRPMFRFGSLAGVAILLLCLNSSGQAPPTAGPSDIQDNSFLVEEAYNQNFGVVQHISSFTRFWDSKDWIYSFTQEWPVPRDPRHQLSYTLSAVHTGAFPDSGVGIGDVFLNYRYQLVGGGDTRVAFSPRFTLIFPSGDSTVGRGAGSLGLQTNLPLSVVLSKKLVSHWNAGASFFPHAQDTSGDRSAVAGYNVGQSFIWLARTRFNVMLETVFTGSQTVVANNRTSWTNTLFISPGIRWSYNLKNGLQIVPGIGVPLGVGPSADEKAILLYLSFEHPFRKLPDKK
jgi:hypothetical protein